MTLEQCEAKLLEILEPMKWALWIAYEKWTHSHGDKSAYCKVFIIPKQTAPWRVNEICINKSTWDEVYTATIDEIEKTKRALAWGEAVPEEVEF